jgi:hypothetical protein
MRRHIALNATAAPSNAKGSLACLVFVAVLGGAFWVGALWATQPWAH